MFHICSDPCASLMVQSSSCGAPFLLGPQRKNVGLVPTVHHGRKNSQSRDR
nr:Ycf15 [Megathyrsus maximus]